MRGLAIDLVTYNDEYSGIYKNLLGKVVIADNLDNAIRIARKNKNSFRIVTLDGQVLNAGGSMTGGSALGNTGILSRANELKKLAGQEKSLEEAMLLAEREYNDAVRDKNAAEYELETSGAEIRAIEDKVLKFETDLKHYQMLLAASAESIELLKTEAAALKNRISANMEETEKTRSDIAELENRLSDIRSQITRYTEGREDLINERNRLTNALSELRALEASYDAEREALQKPFRSCQSCAGFLRADASSKSICWRN